MSRIIRYNLIVLLLFASNANSQDKDESHGIFENRQEYYDFMRDVKLEGDRNPELMAMVPMINDIVLMQPFGTTSQKYDTSDGTLGMLANKSIREELEMLDSQYDEIQAANEQIQKRFAEQIRSLDLSDMSSAVDQILKLRSESENELQSTLLPHQMRRLRQLSAASQLKKRSLVQIITSEPMKSELEVTDEQARTLRMAEKEIEADLQKQIAELRAKARKRLLSNLKSDQRKQVEEIFGPELKSTSSTRKNK